jgi:steroid delta-isomerase-like uncharacterized protein
MYDLISAHDIDAFGEFLADDFIEHEELPAGGPTREGVKAFFRMQIAAFPDFAMTMQDIIDGGDKVVARARFTGTHEAEFMGIPATGRPVDVQLIDIMRFADDDLVHEHWGVFDAMAMMQQLRAPAS